MFFWLSRALKGPEKIKTTTGVPSIGQGSELHTEIMSIVLIVR